MPKHVLVALPLSDAQRSALQASVPEYEFIFAQTETVTLAQVLEADIIMGSREEFDLTEKLIKEGMTDEESAAYWQSKNAKIVVIKHGMKGSTAYTVDGQKFSIKPFPVEARKGFGGGDGYGSGFLYGLYQGWEIIDCLEFGSAEASMMVKSNNCSDSLPGPDEVHAFIKEEKEKFGEMIARV